MNLSFKFCVVCKPDLSTICNFSVLMKITSLSQCDSIVWQMFTNISEKAMLPSHFNPADGDSVFLWNNSKHLHPRRQQSSQSSLWEPQVSLLSPTFVQSSTMKWKNNQQLTLFYNNTCNVKSPSSSLCTTQMSRYKITCTHRDTLHTGNN
jgi:hypothetical protein